MNNIRLILWIQTIALRLTEGLQTADYVKRDSPRDYFITKSETFISDNHLVLIS